MSDSAHTGSKPAVDARPPSPNHRSPGYPSPSMQPSYSYPPPNGDGTADAYRSSPSSIAVTANPPVNLPSIRQQLDQVHAPAPVPSQPAAPQPSPLPSSGSLPQGYYPQHPLPPPPGQPLPPLGSSPHDLAAQYALGGPGQTPRSRASQEKQIKRRTKTGCLTCRKRRIKCDETHPVCRNCQKSKRECLGYDPIFKQQPGPAQIQPAPSAGSPSAHSSASASTQAVPPPVPQQSFTPPQAPPPYDANFASQTPSAPPPGVPAFDSIDPSLSNPNGSTMAAPVPANSQPVPTHLGRSLAFARRVKKLRPEDLFAVSGIAPPAQVPDGFGDPDPETMEMMKTVYFSDYAAGLDAMLDTNWYVERGYPLLQKHPGICRLFGYILHLFKTIKADDYDGNRRLQGLEAKLVWQLMCLCKAPAGNDTNGVPADASRSSMLEELLRRQEILEKLVTGQLADSNPVSYLRYPEHREGSPEWAELKFWQLLGLFVSFRGDDDTQAKSIETAFQIIRDHLLGTQENRDVLYSIAIAQHLGGITPGFPHHIDATYQVGNSDSNPDRLAVAKGHVERTAQGQGITQVVQRICGMAVVSWAA